MGYYSSYGGFAPYVSVGERMRNAERESQKLRKQGRKLSPIKTEGRKVADSFWGKAWCENLESYSDYESRLPRGRNYLKNGLVIDLQVAPGKVSALVYGSELYKVEIAIARVKPKKWSAIASECAGKISSVVALLGGKIPDEVIATIAKPGTGLFPSPQEISLECSCPDWAGMCKHIAAALYGIGARLDESPELFFTLRQADHADLVTAGTASLVERATSTTATARRLAPADLSSVFGIELDAEPEASVAARTPVKVKSKVQTKTKSKSKSKSGAARLDATPAIKPASSKKPQKSKRADNPPTTSKSSSLRPPAQSKRNRRSPANTTGMDHSVDVSDMIAKAFSTALKIARAESRTGTTIAARRARRKK